MPPSARVQKGPFVMFTYESELSVILLISIMERFTDDVTLGRKTQKILTCYTSSWGIIACPRSNIAVLQLCYTAHPFVIPDVGLD